MTNIPQQDTRRPAAPPPPPTTAVQFVQQIAERITYSVSQVIVGKRNEIRLTVLGLLCQGHVLIDDKPGLGKTTLAKALSRSIGCTFSRIQCVPDMLPSDVRGVHWYNEKTREFEFRPGPIMAQIVLVDEINRTEPKTQSALLEVMEERQVTVDGTTYMMPEPFLVLATQNPIEYEGTFPLPEAQLDRFLLRIELGYPTPQEEMIVLSNQQVQHPLNATMQVVSVEELRAAQRAVREVYVADEIKRYIVELVGATRNHADIYLGSSPRGSLALFRSSQARAAMDGRDYVIPDDIKALAEVTLTHRLILNESVSYRDIAPRTIVRDLVAKVPPPGVSPR